MALLSGSCACGGVRVEIDEPLPAAIYCHCTRCQKRTGGRAGASARLAPGSLRFVAGEELLTDWTPEGGMTKRFCSVCGAGVAAADPVSGDTAVIRLGMIDGDPGVRPSAHQHVAYAASWEDVPDDGLPRFPEAVGASEPRS